jgi:DNA-binding beta-propeller fold protein YncE
MDRTHCRAPDSCWGDLIAYILLATSGICGAALARQAIAQDFEVTGEVHVPSAGGLWDYATVDADSRRLYLTANGVLSLNLATHRATPQLVRGNSTHGIVTLPAGVVAVADGSKHQVTLFVGTSGRVLAEIPTGGQPSAADWHDPDALVFEPQTQRLVAVNGDTGTLALIDMRRRVVDGVVHVGGKLESAAAAGNGLVYVNVESQSQLALVDVLGRRVLRRIALQGCKDPTGLAYDSKDHLVISACSNGVAEFLRVGAGAGSDAIRLKIGRGCDAVLLDASRGFAYFPAGDSGTLSIVALRGPRNIKLVQTLTTAPGVRLGAIDPVTGVLYLPAVNYDPAAPPIILPGLAPLPSPVPRSFRFLMVGRERR